MLRLLISVLGIVAYLQAHDPITTKLTWTQEISRIVDRRCATCHSDGGSAPMPLTTYADVRPWAKAIKDEVLHRRMPPWGAVKGFGDFRDDASLTQDEIMRIAEWVEGGAPEGDAIYLPAPSVRIMKPSAPAGRVVRKIDGPIRLLAIRPLSTISSAQAIATLPDGSIIPLIWLRDYKKAFSRTFEYRDPLMLPRGTKVTVHPKFLLEYVVDAKKIQSGASVRRR